MKLRTAFVDVIACFRVGLEMTSAEYLVFGSLLFSMNSPQDAHCKVKGVLLRIVVPGNVCEQLNLALRYFVNVITCR